MMQSSPREPAADAGDVTPTTVSTGGWWSLQIPAAILLFFIGVIFGGTDRHLVSVACVATATIVLFLGYIVSTILSMLPSSRRSRRHTMSASQSKDSVFGSLFAYLMKKSFFVRLDLHIRDTVVSGAVRAGNLQNPIKVSRDTLTAFTVCVPVCVAAAAIVTLLTGHVAFILLALAPCCILMVPRLSNAVSTTDLSAGYDRDLAYFLSFLHIGRMTLYHSMVYLLNRNIFPAIERDARMLERWVKFDGLSESTAINNMANRHANDTFRKFLFAYFDISRSNPAGIDNFVGQAATNEFSKLITSDEKGVGRASAIFVFGGIALIMVPSLLIVMSFAVPEANIIAITSMTIMVSPLFFTVIAILMYRKPGDIEIKFRRYSLCGVLLCVPCYAVTSDALTSVSLGVAVMCIVNGIHASRQISAVRSQVDGFPPFVRDLIERRKVDSNFIVSLKRIFEYDMEKKYGRFQEILHNVRYTLNTFADCKQDLFFSTGIRSERLRMMMFVLQSIFDGGHRSAVTSLERLHSFSEQAIRIKNKIDDTLRLSSLLLLFSPLLLFVTLSAISALMLSFTSNVPVIPEGVHIDAASAKYFQKFDVAAILTAMQPAVFVMSMCSGIVVSRVAYSSFAATMPLGVCMSVAFVIFVGWDFFFEVISSLISDV